MTDLSAIVSISFIFLGIGYWLARWKSAKSFQNLSAELERAQRDKFEVRETSMKSALEGYKSSDEFRALLALRYENGKSHGSAKSVADFKASAEFNSLLTSEYAKGKLTGATEESDKFQITHRELQAEVVRLQCNQIEIRKSAIKSAIEEYKDSEEFRALLALQFESGRAQGSAKSLSDFKTSDEFHILLNSEHAKGKLAGAAEELEKFHITYTPVLVDHETFFSHKVDAGYDMQIHYAGFPIGEPTRRITNHEEKSKDENIMELLKVVGTTLEIAAAAAKKQKIPVTIAKTAKRVTKK